MKTQDELRLDKSFFSISSDFEDKHDQTYWWDKSVQERLLQMEHLRRINYGHRATQRLQRVLEIAESTSS